MNNKSELLAPCFPSLSISADIEVELNKVNFSFVIGSQSIECEIEATERKDSTYIEPQFSPEHGRDVDYTRLEVDNKTLALVTRSDFEESPAGLKFILTEYQVYVMNEWLKEYAIEKIELI